MGAMNHSAQPSSWHLVVPVKGGSRAKSRLAAPAGVDHGDLAQAIAMDTVLAAAEAVTRHAVVVVTSEAPVEALARSLGVLSVPDPAGGLNAAVTAGLAWLAEHAPRSRRGVLLGDLPALQAWDLVAALLEAEAHQRAFVPDAAGTGTVLLTAVAGVRLEPRFGPDSAERHERAGCTRLAIDSPRLRTDVDDAASLRAALRLGVGAHTAALVAHLVAPEVG